VSATKPECPRLSVFSEHWHGAQLCQFCLKHSPLFPRTFFHDVIFVQICQFCALHWAKIAFFCLPEVFCVEKYVRNAFLVWSLPLTPLGNSRCSPRPPSQLGRGTLPHSVPRFSHLLLTAFSTWLPLGASNLVPHASLVPLRSFRAGYRPASESHL